MAQGTTEILFPIGGIDRRTALQHEPPYTTPAAQNVRPRDTYQQRERGGSRPGASRAYAERIGTGPVALLNSTRPLRLTSAATLFDDFAYTAGTLPAPPWAGTWNPSTVGNLSATTLGALTVAEPSSGAILCAAIHDAISGLDSAQPYTIAMRCVADTSNVFVGTYYMYVGLTAVSPNPTLNGLTVSAGPFVDLGGGVVQVEYVLAERIAGVLTQLVNIQGLIYAPLVDVSVKIDPATAKVYLNGSATSAMTLTTIAGTRFAIGAQKDTAKAGGQGVPYPAIDSVSVSYQSVSQVASTRRRLVASANRDTYYEDANSSAMALYSGNSLRLRTLPPLDSVERNGVLFIADYGATRKVGTDGATSSTTFSDSAGTNWASLGVEAGDVVQISAGTQAQSGNYVITAIAGSTLTLASAPGNAAAINYRIEVGPKRWDQSLASANQLAAWSATAGNVPLQCPLIALYQDSIILAGPPTAPNNYFFSRTGNPFDFDYGAPASDIGRALAGALNIAGGFPGGMTALITHSRDYLLMATSNTLCVMRGHPSRGGALETLSHVIGIVDQRAWCYGPSGELYFLSHDGVYVIAGGAEAIPQALSRERLPQELTDIMVGDSGSRVCMAYEQADRGIAVYVSPATTGIPTQGWYSSLQTPGWWRDVRPRDQDVFSTISHEIPPNLNRRIVMGCRDGYLRHANPDTNDDGTAIDSSVVIGPISLGPPDRVGILAGLMASTVISGADARLTWSVYVGDTITTANAAMSLNIPDVTGTWSDGLNYRDLIRQRGKYAYIRIDSVSGSRWAFDSLSARIEAAGLLRKA